jgi:hypothetical protein
MAGDAILMCEIDAGTNGADIAADQFEKRSLAASVNG